MIGHVKVINLQKIYRVPEKRSFLKRTYKTIRAIDNVSFEVNPGEIFGLLGPNGAGKTTLIKVLTTLLIPDNGDAYVNGYNVLKEPYKVRATIGVMLMGERSLYWKLTGRENLEYFAALYHIPKNEIKRRVNEIIDFVGIQDFADRLVETYSSGQKMLLAFAKALINDAPILFLDEPTIAMDPNRAMEVRELIRKLNEKYKKTIFLTTHLMNEADTLCHRVAIIDKGRIVAMDTPQNLRVNIPHKGAIEIEIQGRNIQNIINEIRNINGIEKIAYSAMNTDQTVSVRILCDSPRNVLPDVMNVLISHKEISIRYINPTEPTLEDVFIYYTGRRLSEDTREEAL